MLNFKVNYSLVVAIIALTFSIWQGRAQIAHNYVSVEPRVNSYFSNNGKEDQWGVYITNNGMGTAFVKSLDVYVDGKIVPNHKYGKFYSAVLKLNLNPGCFMMGGPRPNDSFQVGDEQFLIEAKEYTTITPKSCPLNRLQLMEYQKTRLDYKLRIESIYGDLFEYHYAKNIQVGI